MGLLHKCLIDPDDGLEEYMRTNRLLEGIKSKNNGIENLCIFTK